MAKIIFSNTNFSLKAKELIIHYGVDFDLDLGVGKSFQSLDIPKPINGNFDISIRLSYIKDNQEIFKEIKKLNKDDKWSISMEEIDDFLRKRRIKFPVKKIIVVFHYTNDEAFKVGFPSIQFKDSFVMEYKALIPLSTKYTCTLWYAEEGGSWERLVTPARFYEN